MLLLVVSVLWFGMSTGLSAALRLGTPVEDSLIFSLIIGVVSVLAMMVGGGNAID